MGTPSTAAAVAPHQHYFPLRRSSHYRDYPQLSGLGYAAAPTRPPVPTGSTSLTASTSIVSNHSSPTDTRAASTATAATTYNPAVKRTSTNASIAWSAHQSPEMPPPAKVSGTKRRADWDDFYKNGQPTEVIVIDDTPEPNGAPPRAIEAYQAPAGATASHVDKRRRVGAAGIAEPVVGAHYGDVSTTNSESSRGRSTVGNYSTAPTSLASQSSTSQRAARLDNTQIGQKRKRKQEEDEDDELQLSSHVRHDPWGDYVPPPRPPIKARDVHVKVIPDVSALGFKTNGQRTYTNQKCDDADGHYVVMASHDLTDRCTYELLQYLIIDEIVRQLGQGTFGKVVEAYDRATKSHCAIKIIRAVPKYRDASRIELRVLATLATNDKLNRNRCIHFRECFDFRNHICIVTDLLSESVFDFLKKNSFVPFPNTHIQSFAKQLFTSVAFLHDLNLIHTDLKPENILLVSNAYQTFTYNRNIPSSSRGTSRTSKQRRVLFDPEIRLIDFGSATFDDEYHSSVVSTRHYRAPEIILNLGWSFPCDIWSIGCILVEFYTGDALFQTHDNLEHLAMMESVCGSTISREIIDKVRAKDRRGNQNTAAQYFRPRAYSLNYPNSETPRQSRKFVKNMKRLEETIPPETRFNRLFLDLLRRIFVYDPSRRISAHEALQHPWFKEPLEDDGTEAKRIMLNKAKHRAR